MANESTLLFAFDVLKNIGYAVVVTDKQLKIEHANNLATALFKSAPHEIIGSEIQSYFIDQSVSQGLEERAPFTIATNLRLLQSNQMVSVKMSNISNSKHEIVGYSLIVKLVVSPVPGETDIFNAIINNSKDAIVSKSLNGIILSWNRAAEMLYDFTAEEAIGQHISLIVPADELQEELQTLDEVRKGNNVNTVSTTRKTRTGQKIKVSQTASPIKDSEGIVIAVSQISRDISNELLAAEKQAFLASIIEGSDDAIISKDLNGVISSWNKGAEQIFGYASNEVIGLPITILIPEERRDEETNILNNIRKGIKIDHFQTVRLHKSGKHLDISLTVSPIKDLNGNIVGASKVARDISLQKKTERKLAINNIRLRRLNALGKTINSTLEINAILQAVTDVATELTGAEFGAFFYNSLNNDGEAYMLYTLSGASYDDFKNFGMPRKTEVFRPTFDGDATVRVDDISKDPRYGKNKPYMGMPPGHLPVTSYLSVPVVSVSGKVLGGLFFGHQEPAKFRADHEDLVVAISHQTAVALDNTNLVVELKDLSKQKDDFIALATHELKTPLTSMGGFLQLLQHRSTDEQNNPLIEKVMKQLKKLNTLFNDLFDISRIQAGKLQLNFEEVDVCSLISDIISNYSETASAHIFNLDADKSCIIEADKMRLEQAINNLINNAIKYSSANTEININIRKQSDKLIVDVKDNGIGIGKAYQQNIFSQFYRARDVSGTIAGLGLGLFITKQIIERHNGIIEVTSELNKGTTFTVTLPVQQPQ